MRVELRTLTGLSILLGLAASSALWAGAAGEEPAHLDNKEEQGKDFFLEMKPEAQVALRAIQDHIAKTQKPNGAFVGDKDPGEDALCSIALLAGGSSAGVGPYGKEIALSVNNLLSIQDNTGFFPSTNGQHGMYGHALATLFMTEVWGLSKQPDLKDKVRKAVQLIVDCQNKDGGWRYHPKIEDADLSVTVMEVMALRSAMEAGIYVPEQTIERAVKYIKSCYSVKEGGFGYQNQNSPKFSTSGAGVTALQTVGVYKDAMIEKGLMYIQDKGWGGNKEWFWYGHYYSSVAMYHEGGAKWEKYYPAIRKIAIEYANKKDYKNQPLWQTSFVALVLAMPYRYIPIYQR